MAGNVTFKVPMDNRIQPGDQTVNEVVLSLQQQGHAPQVTNHVRDPITGKLLYVDVQLPEASSASGQAAIDGNPGKAGKPVIAIPDGWVGMDLHATQGIYYDSMPTLADGDVGFTYFKTELAFGNETTSILTNSLGSLTYGWTTVWDAGVYTDGSPTNAVGLYTVLQIINNTTDPVQLVPGNLHFKLLDNTVLTPVLSSSFTLQAPLNPFVPQITQFYLDVNYKMYLRSDSSTTAVRTYAEAVAAGAL